MIGPLDGRDETALAERIHPDTHLRGLASPGGRRGGASKRNPAISQSRNFAIQYSQMPLGALIPPISAPGRLRREGKGVESAMAAIA